jgi:hypothetical protein
MAITEERRPAVWLIEDRGTILIDAAYSTRYSAMTAAEALKARNSPLPRDPTLKPEWRMGDLGRYILWYPHPIRAALAETRVAVVYVPVADRAEARA